VKLRDKDGNEQMAAITCEHPAASYMRPVLFVDGQTYKPDEARQAGFVVISLHRNERAMLKQGGYALPDETPAGIAAARGAHKAQVGLSSMLVWGALRASTEPLSEEAIIKIFDDIPADVVRDALTLLVTEHKAQPLGGAIYKAIVTPPAGAPEKAGNP